MSTQTQKTGKKKPNVASLLLLAALLCALTYFVWQNVLLRTAPTASVVPPVADMSDNGVVKPSAKPEEPEEEIPDFSPYAVDSTQPSNYIVSTAIEVNGEIVPEYLANASDTIDFSLGQNYTKLQGVTTFRGNNFRDTPTYGTADLTTYEMEKLWSVSIGSLTAPNGTTWTGSGWTGQPIIVKWPSETRQIMNMYDWAKAKEDLVEVIYATMDGNVYFMELESGQKTRDTLTLGYTFKGAGSLDPRGYPLLYLGAGYDSSRGKARAMIVSLIDGSVLYEYGNNDSFAMRGLSFFDSAALVDADTDQLIHPGENGVLYITKLNTDYNEEAGTISINPSQVVKWRYKGTRTTNNVFWLGMEDSPVIFRGHIIVTDNGGNLMCLNLNTLQLAWVQDVLDDSNSTPVLELEDGHPYVYISTSFHANWRAGEHETAVIPIWKIDAVTGEIVWQKDYNCRTVDGTSGGVQGTIAVGKNQLSDLIFVPVARTPGGESGILAAINKNTGEVVWEQETQMYSWSSPVIVYDSAGKGHVILGTLGGYLYTFDGLTGEVLSFVDLESHYEASPAVYNDMLVVGTRGQQIFGIKLK